MRIRPLLASMAVAGVAAAAIPAATAAPGNAVVLGDSLAANPTVVDYLAAKSPAQIPGARVNGAGCGTDFRFSGAYGAAAGRHADDYTCAGASYRTGGMRISEQIDRAAASGALDAGTAEVVIMAGANDTYPYVLNEHMPVPEIQENLRVAVRDAVNQARAHAPNARIKLVGFPTISSPEGNVCLINVTPGPGLAVPGVNIREIEDALQGAVAQAAGDTGAQFVDVKGMSADHHQCSADRWVAGVVDTTAGPHNLIVHMTDAGLSAVGDYAGRA